MASLTKRVSLLASVAGLAVLTGCGFFPPVIQPQPPAWAYTPSPPAASYMPVNPPPSFDALPQQFSPPVEDDTAPVATVPPEPPPVAHHNRHNPDDEATGGPPATAKPEPALPVSPADNSPECIGYWRICHFL